MTEALHPKTNARCIAERTNVTYCSCADGTRATADIAEPSNVTQNMLIARLLYDDPVDLITEKLLLIINEFMSMTAKINIPYIV